jgi:hypothetical protein
VWANRDNTQSLAGTVLASSIFIQSGSGESLPDVTAAEYGGGNDDILWAALGWMKYYQFWAAGGGSGKNFEFLLVRSQLISTAIDLRLTPLVI